MPINEPTDIFKYYEMRGDDECWPYIGHAWNTQRHLSRPYFMANGRRMVAYRWIYELVNGVTLTPDQLILHSCDNGAYPVACGNPAHMRIGTDADNNRDMVSRQRNAMPHRVVLAIRRLLEMNVTQQEIANRYGVSREAISAIATQRSYRHVQDQGILDPPPGSSHMAKPPDRTVTVSVSTQVHPPHPEHPPHPDKPPEQPPGEIDNTLPTPPSDARPDHTLPTPEPPDPIVTTGRSVTITIGDTQHQFTQEGGTDLGAYVDPHGHFTQHCIRSTCATLPAFSVMFRPDADGQREEVVFELGYIWNTDPLANLGAYTARIYKDGAEMATVEAPKHNYYGRWRWQSAPRPVVNDVRSLIDAGLVPHYTHHQQTPPSQQRHYAGPMDLAGIEPYMPSTGGRDDIGLVTECQGDYLCTSSEAALNSLRAQLEGSGSLPWHFRDENTGAPLDIHAYPRCSSRDQYDGNPNPFIPLGWVDSGITLDTSHEPDLGYVPYLLTGDPYALEELQYTVTYNYVCLAPDAKSWYNLTGAVRAHAWSLRCMARAARVTPDTVPQWLMPRSHFKQLLDGNRDFVASRAASTVAPLKEMHLLEDGASSPAEWFVEGGCCVTPWMEDFEQAVLGHVVELGFDDWRANYEWKILATQARIDGVGGWNRYMPFPYKIAARANAQSPWVNTWQECWDLNLSLGSVEAGDPAHMRPEGDLNYPMVGLAVMATAKRLGIEGAEAAYTWLQQEVGAMITSSSYIHARWSIT